MDSDIPIRRSARVNLIDAEGMFVHPFHQCQFMGWVSVPQSKPSVSAAHLLTSYADPTSLNTAGTQPAASPAAQNKKISMAQDCYRKHFQAVFGGRPRSHTDFKNGGIHVPLSEKKLDIPNRPAGFPDIYILNWHSQHPHAKGRILLMFMDPRKEAMTREQQWEEGCNLPLLDMKICLY